MVKSNEDSTQHEKLVLELRRGVLVLATLSQLEEAKYGYSLKEELSAQGLEIDQGTLYPLLRRLEAQGLLDSQWNVEGSRPRRYYQLSPTGSKVLGSLTQEWVEIVRVMDGFLLTSEGKDDDESN